MKLYHNSKFLRTVSEPNTNTVDTDIGEYRCIVCTPSSDQSVPRTHSMGARAIWTIQSRRKSYLPLTGI
jgi:hypothetical protein